MLDLTVIILTKNEELHIERCLKNIKPIARRIVVVDSFSSDRTKQIALTCGAEFYEHPFINQAKQFQWALDYCDIRTAWVMRLDADELIEDDLKRNLLDAIPNLDKSVVGINLKRKHYFWGKWIRFGGRYPVILLRIWRAGHGEVEDRWMDEHILVHGGSTITIKGGFCDVNLNDLSSFIEKHNKYATREAIDVILKRRGIGVKAQVLTRRSTSVQAVTKRFIKERVYNRIDFPVSSLLYFVWRYFFQFGFLDGRPGLVYHFLQGYWYRFLVGAKIRELEKVLALANDENSFKSKLEKATGFKIQ